jgi:pregnancy-associated plasma protein-A
MADDLTPGPVQVLVTVGMRTTGIPARPMSTSTTSSPRTREPATPPSPWAGGPHAIILTAKEEKKNADDWRGIALAHEFGHYLGLLHTHADDPSDDATYTDHCGDTDVADPHNVMTQGIRGRSTNPSVIHLTADQIARARGYLFGRWPNLVAETVAGAIA